MSIEPVRFAVVGCGMLARSQHIPNLLRSSKACLKVCADLDERVLDECRQRFGVQQLYRDYQEAIADPEVEAIVLATTEKLRLPVIRAAAHAGKPIYIEKPLARTLEEMYQIQQIIQDAGISACVGHNRRCSPAMLDAHRLFRQHMTAPQSCHWRFDREGAARWQLEGDGVAAAAVRINDDWYSWKSWVFDKQHAPHGPMLCEMTHFTDVCNWFLAAEPQEVVALEHGVFNEGVVIRYRTGEMATISMCANGTFGYPKELYEFMGNGGLVAVDHMVEVRTAGLGTDLNRKTYPMIHDRHPSVGAEGGISGWLAKKEAACREAAEKNDPLLQFTAEPDKGWAQALDRFAEEIRSGGPMVCSIADAILATRVAFAAVQSAQQRRIVPLEEV